MNESYISFIDIIIGMNFVQTKNRVIMLSLKILTIGFWIHRQYTQIHR